MPADSGAPPDLSVPLWSFRDDVHLEPAAGGGLVVLTRWGDIEIDQPVPAIADCLHRMTLGPVALSNVAGLDVEDLHKVFLRLPGCVVRSLGLRDSATPLLSAVPLSPRGVLELPDLDPALPVRLSRFAAVRRAREELLLESPLSHHRVELHRPLATWVVSALGRATTSAEIARGINVTGAIVAEIIAYLVATGMAVAGSDDRHGAAFAEDRDPDLLAWSSHDLMFHSRSRIGRHDDPAGAVFRNTHLAPLPAVRPARPGRRFPLPRPDDDAAQAGPGPSLGLSLAEAVERRRSVRAFAVAGPSPRQLGELLFRAARVRSQTETAGAGGVRYAVSDRPYPSAGSLYELDMYLTVDRCGELPRGIYHYDPAGHSLTLVNESAGHVGELLDSAMVLTSSDRPPPVLITMTARMGRLSWVYDGICYATTLKHVGVLQQTLYLVATDLGLAPCALAMGDSDLTAAAFGLDWPAEVSVGEFVVGLPAAED